MVSSSSFLRILFHHLLQLYHNPHPSTMAEQTEKAFLKQPKVFLCSKKTGKGKRPGKGGNRYWKNVGLGFKTPRDAIEGTYIDKKCPFTGDVSIRGRILAGTCHSAKMMRTIIVRRNYLHFVKKYQRYEKRHSNIPAHISPCFRVKEGDHVTIGQCRPLSKTVRFNVLKVIPAGSSAGGKKAFTAISKEANRVEYLASLFEEIKKSGSLPNVRTYTIMMSFYCKGSYWNSRRNGGELGKPNYCNIQHVHSWVL
ncbi:unnamed protein product [Camellia sinensis]